MQRWIIIIAVVAVVLLYMTADTVRFTESAVVTTFGKATEENVRKGSDRAGLLFTVPWVQRVTKYDTRKRILEARPEMQQTRDDRQIVLTPIVTWEVSDPLKFYQRFAGSGRRIEDHYREAERVLRSKVRSSLSEVGRFRLDEILSAREDGSRLAELEDGMLRLIRASAAGDAALADYGITAVSVGIASMTFPQETSKKVFDAMKTSRATIANETISQGTSRADTIRKTAEADAERIRVFANRLANNIRARGDAEAAQYLKQMDEEPELAVFLQNMKFFREAFGKTTTLVLPTSMPGFEMLRPDTIRKGLPSVRPAATEKPEDDRRAEGSAREGGR